MAETKVNLISHQKLESMTADEKIDYILGEVKHGEVMILERGLTPEEQSKLIEKTMKEINPDKFIGIEMESYREDGKLNWLQKMMGKIRPPRMTVIGPADKLKTIQKDNDIIKTVILGR